LTRKLDQYESRREEISRKGALSVFKSNNLMAFLLPVILTVAWAALLLCA
jgi:hypothetical protein